MFDDWQQRLYRSYLDAASQVDDWVKQIWDFIQSDEQYRNKTTLFITTESKASYCAGNKISHSKAMILIYEVFITIKKAQHDTFMLRF
jgi:hypothetical protein